MSVISCISFADSSPNLFLSHPYFLDETWLQKEFDICLIDFHVRSNVSIMAGNRDTVSQSES